MIAASFDAAFSLMGKMPADEGNIDADGA